MKKNLHPERRDVIFRDMVTGATFLVKSTMEAAETMMWSDGREYPVVAVEISSSSHPAYTGEQLEVEKQARAIEFVKKYAREHLH
jgi:large subunit ribosomal protein L31